MSNTQKNALTDALLESDAFVALIMKGDELKVVGSAHLSQEEVTVLLYTAMQGSLYAGEEPLETGQLH